MNKEAQVFMKRFFIADPHFGDGRIMKYENRPFESVAQMDEALIENWNVRVTSEDEVYVLGDFGADGCEQQILNQLNGTKYLIKGNHDTKSNESYRQAGFREVYDHPIILDNFWILSHKPLYVNSNMPYANLFGHVHTAPQYRDYSSQHYCVSVERIDYTPISFDEVKAIIQEAVRNE
jgi:calcineurin-like phosphoesterase family protein